MSLDTSASAPLPEDLAYQNQALQGVSRTFALTIPQLPDPLRTVVGNGYLLCRIADTIEDSPVLTLEDKKRFSGRFVSVVCGSEPAEPFASELEPLLKDGATPDERDLVRNTPRVIRVTHGFSATDRAALCRCVGIMAEGMERFQEGQYAHGLRDQAHMDEYCYYVAGVVGEMLTELFCTHCDEVAASRERLKCLGISFGLGLQMTNILKDLWDDLDRGVCWLPRDTFARHGFNLDDLRPGQTDPAFREGLIELIGVTRTHLDNALNYTLLIPPKHRGVRQFCLWAIGMAVLTLRNLHKNPDFQSGRDVKITRRNVRWVVAGSRLLGGNNYLLRRVFRHLTRGLPAYPASIPGRPTARDN